MPQLSKELFDLLIAYGPLQVAALLLLVLLIVVAYRAPEIIQVAALFSPRRAPRKKPGHKKTLRRR